MGILILGAGWLPGHLLITLIKDALSFAFFR
jgi:hypothetical protein